MQTSNQNKKLLLSKIIAIAIWIVIIGFAAKAFYEHRNFKEPVVLGPGVTSVKKLSDWYGAIKGSVNDCNIYILDSGKPGANMLILGGTHPEEPAGNITAELLVENAELSYGKLIIAIHSNRSASTVTRPGEGYPQFYSMKTPWGSKKYRMGDRYANPLDSWPDPETYIHYPSKQMLAYMDIRNTNRTWPGRANGSLSEKTNYAFMQLIHTEKVDLVIDLHEAELEYPVIGTIVAHQKAQELAALVSMDLSANQFRIGMEISPKSLHGLTHREIGDFSNAAAILIEAPEPFLDRVRGVTDEKLLLTGKDEFVMRAGKAGLLYWPIDENGWPIETRVARHITTISKTFEAWTLMNPEKPIEATKLPTYSQIELEGLGDFIPNPSSEQSNRIEYE